ncbi:MAG: hypothetical protein US53_C0048G0005 [Candidatus Woesebacteria bacterium GW2011_GWA1_37_7]|nr:MAG: hypothetical protein US53_C0048G0005 [Candidatus Woesebacteria bacterium GW2011_GWA1_37_7]
MIRIRLSRGGKRNKPFFSIVAIKRSKKAKGGSPLAILGSWQPDKKRLTLDKEKLNSWVSKGAQVSLTLKNLMKS